MKINLTDPVKLRLNAQMHKQMPHYQQRLCRQKRVVLYLALLALTAVVMMWCFFPDVGLALTFGVLALVGGLISLALFLLVITSPAWGSVLLVKAGTKIVEKQRAEKQARDFRERQPYT